VSVETCSGRAREQFVNPEERKLPPLEAVSKRMTVSATEDTSGVIVICKVWLGCAC
jgi:hypothetical protein